MFEHPGPQTVTHRTPQQIMDEIAALDAESAEVLAGIRPALSAAEGGLL